MSQSEEMGNGGNSAPCLFGKVFNQVNVFHGNL